MFLGKAWNFKNFYAFLGIIQSDKCNLGKVPEKDFITINMWKAGIL